MSESKNLQRQISEKLKAPFSPKDIEWRVQRAMKTKSGNKAVVIAYVTARAIMDRLDEVVGLGNWQDNYERWGGNSVKCILSVKFYDEWVSKEDGADETQFEATKGGFSSALKRAAVKWGIGRYLYDLDEIWVGILPKGDNYINDKKTGIVGGWNDPQLPDWALPEADRGKTHKQQPKSAQFDEVPLEQLPQELPKEKPKAQVQPKEQATTEPISQNQIRAIQKTIEVAAKNGNNVSLESALQSIGKSPDTNLESLSYEDGKRMIIKINQMMRAG